MNKWNLRKESGKTAHEEQPQAWLKKYEQEWKQGRPLTEILKEVERLIPEWEAKGRERRILVDMRPLFQLRDSLRRQISWGKKSQIEPDDSFEFDPEFEKWIQILPKEYKVAITYQTWDAEAAEAGDTDDRGFEMEPEETDLDGLLEAMSSDFFTADVGSTRWWETSPDEDFRTGGTTTKALHISLPGGAPLPNDIRQIIDSLVKNRSLRTNFEDYIYARSEAVPPGGSPGGYEYDNPDDQPEIENEVSEYHRQIVEAAERDAASGLAQYSGPKSIDQLTPEERQLYRDTLAQALDRIQSQKSIQKKQPPRPPPRRRQQPQQDLSSGPGVIETPQREPLVWAKESSFEERLATVFDDIINDREAQVKKLLAPALMGLGLATSTPALGADKATILEQQMEQQVAPPSGVEKMMPPWVKQDADYQNAFKTGWKAGLASPRDEMELIADWRKVNKSRIKDSKKRSIWESAFHVGYEAFRKYQQGLQQQKSIPGLHLPSKGGRLKQGHLVQRDGKWALVSKKDPSKVLKWFGAEKPSDEAVAKEESRVEYFKHQGQTVNIVDEHEAYSPGGDAPSRLTLEQKFPAGEGDASESTIETQLFERPRRTEGSFEARLAFVFNQILKEGAAPDHVSVDMIGDGVLIATMEMEAESASSGEEYECEAPSFVPPEVRQAADAFAQMFNGVLNYWLASENRFPPKGNPKSTSDYQYNMSRGHEQLFHDQMEDAAYYAYLDMGSGGTGLWDNWEHLFTKEQLNHLRQAMQNHPGLRRAYDHLEIALMNAVTCDEGDGGDDDDEGGGERLTRKIQPRVNVTEEAPRYYARKGQISLNEQPKVPYQPTPLSGRPSESYHSDNQFESKDLHMGSLEKDADPLQPPDQDWDFAQEQSKDDLSLHVDQRDDFREPLMRSPFVPTARLS